MKNNIPILIVSTVHATFDARVYFKQTLSLRKKYSNVYLVIPVKTKDKNKIVDKGIIDLPYPKNKFQRFFKLQIIVFREIMKFRPKVIHFHDPELMILMLIVKILFNVKIIIDIHENIPESLEHREWIPRRIRHHVPKIYRLIEKLVIKNFNAVIIVLDSFKKVYGNSAVTIMNYPLQVTNFKKEKKNDLDAINLVYVGGIMVDRGIDEMLNGFKIIESKHTNVFFDLIGPFMPSSLESKVQSFLKYNNLDRKIRIHNRLPIDEVYAVLRNSHIGISMMAPIWNYKYGLSTKIFDYMANGIPYIVSDFEIYDEYTRKENTGVMINYGNIDMLVNEIDNLINNKDLLAKMSDNCFKCVEEKWNWGTQERKLLQLYDNLLKEN